MLEHSGEQWSRLGYEGLLNRKVFASFNHWRTQTPGHKHVLVSPGIYATQYSFPSRQLFRQFLRMMCGTLAAGGKRLFVSQLKVER